MDDPERRVLSAADVLRSYEQDALPDFGEGPLTDVNQRGALGSYPIHIAAVRGAFDEMAALIAGGANVNALGEDGFTALHWAARDGNLNLVKLLLEHGAKADIKDRLFGDTPIDLAKQGGHHAVVKLLTGTDS